MVHERSVGSPRATPYEELVASHAIEIPKQFNLAMACADDMPAGDTALIIADENGGQRMTFGDLTNRSARLAAGLREMGVFRGDRVAVCLPQRWEAVVAALATWRLGAILVPLHPEYGPEALATRLADCRPKVVIVDETSRAAVELIGGSAVVHIREGRGSVRGLIGFNQPAPPVETTSDEPALMLYAPTASGTPRGVVHGHRVLFGALPSAELMFDWLPQPDDVSWSAASWSHPTALLGVVLPSLYHGVPVVCSLEIDPGGADVVDLIRTHSVTAAHLPAHVLRSMTAPGLDLGSLPLRTIATSGDRLDKDTAVHFEETVGVTVNQIFGLPEANLVAGGSSMAWPTRNGSLGRAYPGFSVATVDHNGDAAPDEQPGRLAVRRDHPAVMLEYWKREHDSAARFEGEWLIMDASAAMDTDGYLTITDDADIITSSGHRVGPTEIEQCLMADPAVTTAAVVGVQDDVRGQLIKAFIVAVDRSQATPETAIRLAERCGTRLAPFLAPKRISFVADLPTSESGQISRRRLRDA